MVTAHSFQAVRVAGFAWPAQTDTRVGCTKGYTSPCDDGKEVEWGWDVDTDLSLGCSVRGSNGSTIDLPLGAVIGTNQCIDGRSMGLASRRETFPSTAESIVASATGLFQGAYYQWGGITPWGADCSGMVQSVFALHGIHLLRDAWQQATQGLPVDGGLEAAKAGDLLFFTDREDGHITHVAMSMGPSRVVHVAIGRGGHSVEKLDEPDDYTAGLIGRFRVARRIVG
jgi:cell wall-associated NlpC family hydrolase